MNMSPDALILSEANINNAEILLRGKNLLNNQNYWHKIIVQDCAGMTRDFVLKAILDNVHPLDLIPVSYTTCYRNASFLARNCAMAIEKLCQQKLVVENPQKMDEPFKLIIILAFSNTKEMVVDVQENIAKTLAKKYNSNTKSLNLDSFHKNADLTEFCILSQRKILFFVLHLSKQFQVHNLRLTNNDIQMLSPIESIWGMKSLTSLDLRFNRIDNISELNILKTMQITELYLEGNPLCDLYDEYTYVQAVREVCPKIQKLDGILLEQNGFLSFRRNFLCNHDGHELVNQFLEHFFTFYDSPNRPLLISLYHENAMFSLTCGDLVGQVSTSTSNLGAYKTMQRNIKGISDVSKSEQCHMKGPKNISDLFTKLPSTEHDIYNITVDLIYYTEVTAIIMVTGVYRQSIKPLLGKQRMLGFTRTFVLLKGVKNEFKIVNEQLYVSNATTSQKQRAFKMLKPNKQLSLQTIKPLKPTSDAEKIKMTYSFKILTKLNLKWSKMFLEDCDYDFRKSLMLFVDLHKDDKIPGGAFDTSSDTFNNHPGVDISIPALPATVVVPSPEVDPCAVVPQPTRKLRRKQRRNRRRVNVRTEYGRLRMPRKLAIAQGLLLPKSSIADEIL